MSKETLSVGFGFGGDANCALTPWTTAFDEMTEARLTMNQPQFMWGVNRKGGDLMVGAGIKDFIVFVNECSIQGREAQHDPMIMRWCYSAQPQTQSVQWEPISDAGGQEQSRTRWGSQTKSNIKIKQRRTT